MTLQNLDKEQSCHVRVGLERVCNARNLNSATSDGMVNEVKPRAELAGKCLRFF
jgi:hypothetical protein